MSRPAHRCAKPKGAIEFFSFFVQRECFEVDSMGSMRPVLSVVLPCCVLLALPAPVEAQISRSPDVGAAYVAGVKRLEEENYEEALVEFSKATDDDTFAEALLAHGDALRSLDDE